MVVKSINCLLADGTTCKIDIGFYHEFKKHNWCCDSNGYIVTNVKINGKRNILYLHHLVLNFKYDHNIDIMVDHKYGYRSDNRSKKLRKVSRSINALNNFGRNTNTGFSRIHCVCYDNRYGYIVTYMNINKLSDQEWFGYIPGENEEDVFLKAFEFYEYTLTLPHYVKARPNHDDDSSSGESVDEINYEHRINIDRLRPTNTSKYNNINDWVDDSYWLVRFYNENGKRRNKSFYYKPKSMDTKDEALIKALLFQKKYDAYHPKNIKKYHKINININNNITIINEHKKKKKKIPLKSKEINDDTTSYENTESHLNMVDNTKNILKKSNMDLMIEGNNIYRKNPMLEFMFEENTPEKSLFDLMLEENIFEKIDDNYEMDIERKFI
jgi:hypothetical protein